MNIAIIGAGISGITAAYALRENNVNVTVFDKARGQGGRLSSKRLEFGRINIGAQYYTTTDERFASQTKDWQERGVVTPWNFTPHKVINGQLVSSPDNKTRYVGTEGMNGLTRDLAEDIDVQYQRTIVKIVKTQNKFTLTDSQENHWKDYDWVVVTLPAEQAKELLTNHPAISEQIPNNIHTPCLAVTLATSGDANKNVAGIFGDNTVSWVSRLSSQPSWRPQHYEGKTIDDVWQVHFSSAFSQSSRSELADVEPEDIARIWINKHLECNLRTIATYTHFWRYANLKKPNMPASPIITDGNNIIATGAWCFGGRVEGGYLAGLTCANTILDTLNNKSIDSLK